MTYRYGYDGSRKGLEVDLVIDDCLSDDQFRHGEGWSFFSMNARTVAKLISKFAVDDSGEVFVINEAKTFYGASSSWPVTMQGTVSYKAVFSNDIFYSPDGYPATLKNMGFADSAVDLWQKQTQEAGW